jgi:hypothetical protein
MRWAAWLGLVCAPSGCIPFALPPGQASAAGATTGEQPRNRASDEVGGYSLRGGVHPLGMIDDQQERPVDVGAGYALERAPREHGYLHAHGPYLEIDAFPVRAHMGSWTARVGVRTLAELLIRDDAGGWGETGGGGTMALALDFATFADGVFATGSSDGFALGAAYGEAGVGAFAGVSHRRFRDDSYWMGSAGLSLRVPLAAGVVCCIR